MICTALSETNFGKCLKMAGKYELAEIRLDLCRFSIEETRILFEKDPNLVVTCRPGVYSEAERESLLVTAIHAGARYADIEIESDKELIGRLKNVTTQKGCGLIVSYHNYDLTPSQEELGNILDNCFRLGADIAKIACMVNHIEDNAVILSMFQYKKRLVAIGMGQLGVITRIVSPFLGAEFTFAAPDHSGGTAPGQLSTFEMKQLFNELKKHGIQS